MKNLKEWKTTVVGIMLMLFSMVFMFKSYWVDGVYKFSDYFLPLLLMGVGMGLMFSPDKIISAIPRALNKVLRNNTEK
jgi:hypothetical protein